MIPTMRALVGSELARVRWVASHLFHGARPGERWPPNVQYSSPVIDPRGLRFEVEVRTDRHGSFRPRESNAARPLRIGILGDSVSECLVMPSSARFSSRLVSHLSAAGTEAEIYDFSAGVIRTDLLPRFAGEILEEIPGIEVVVVVVGIVDVIAFLQKAQPPALWMALRSIARLLAPAVGPLRRLRLPADLRNALAQWRAWDPALQPVAKRFALPNLQPLCMQTANAIESLQQVCTSRRARLILVEETADGDPYRTSFTGWMLRLIVSEAALAEALDRRNATAARVADRRSIPVARLPRKPETFDGLHWAPGGADRVARQLVASGFLARVSGPQ